ncbi:MAG: urease accessory protein UreD [Gammaproteobacteria bacterium]|nr:urease accessory protein UreD [Gammaproteobacteria bacterium]
MSAEPLVSAPPGWRGELQLTLTRPDSSPAGRTVVAARRHLGPLNIQRAFYPEAEVAHIYLLHPPGGVVGGDELYIDVEVQAGAHALITTPASGKLYRSAGRQARLQQVLRVASGATLEWLPQETIVYSGAQAQMSTRVELHSGSRFIGWEMLCLGRPACHETFTRGHLLQRFELWRDNQPIWVERSRFEGGAHSLTADWGMRHKPLAATLVATVNDAALVERIRETAMPAADYELDADAYFSVTQLDEVLVCRYLGTQAQQAQVCLGRAWAEIRRCLLGREPCAPRIWNT